MGSMTCNFSIAREQLFDSRGLRHATTKLNERYHVMITCAQEHIVTSELTGPAQKAIYLPTSDCHQRN